MAPRTHAGSRLLALERYGVDVLVDVGANAGQYATALRADGVATYEGAALLPQLLASLDGFSVVSIEPGHRDVGTGQVYDVDVLLQR